LAVGSVVDVWSVFYIRFQEAYKMKMYWKGHGLIDHGDYYVIWTRYEKRESMMYQIRSRRTGKTILAIEVF
jgi:hypothetical protein